MAGIYIHIPFCKQACHYCNFHFSTSLKYRSDMVNAICKEIELRKDYLSEKEIQSVYLGGGTPSLLNEMELEQIFNTILKHFSFSSGIEITLEVNPDDLDREKCKTLYSSPINRLSIGIQSFFNKDLVFFNRAHNATEARNSIEYAQNSGFNNITCDLIFGSPTSSLSTIQDNISIFLDLEIPHLSTYALTVEEKTAYHRQILTNKRDAPDEVETSNQFDLIMDTLGKNGFVHYEISNFCKPEFEAVHNSNYWRGIPYLGIGPSSHSYNLQSRQWNISNNARYMKAIAQNKIPATREEISKNDRYNEYVMTSLRTIWGCDEAKLFELGQEFLDHFLKIIVNIDHSFFSHEGKKWRLTQKGKHFADRIAGDLFI